MNLKRGFKYSFIHMFVVAFFWLLSFVYAFDMTSNGEVGFLRQSVELVTIFLSAPLWVVFSEFTFSDSYLAIIFFIQYIYGFLQIIILGEVAKYFKTRSI